MAIKALRYNVVVKKAKKTEKTASGIILTTNVSNEADQFEVISFDEAYVDEVEVGDLVYVNGKDSVRIAEDTFIVDHTAIIAKVV